MYYWRFTHVAFIRSRVTLSSYFLSTKKQLSIRKKDNHRSSGHWNVKKISNGSERASDPCMSRKYRRNNMRARAGSASRVAASRLIERKYIRERSSTHINPLSIGTNKSVKLSPLLWITCFAVPNSANQKYHESWYYFKTYAQRFALFIDNLQSNCSV